MKSLNIFNSVQVRKPSSSRFDLSHDVKLSFSMGELVPTLVMETLPGDVFEISTQNLLRFMPMVAPVMHNVNVRMDLFFVPYRILFAEWEKFITGDPDIEAPFIPLGPSDYSTVQVGSLADYLSIPPGEYGNPREEISAFPFAAYLKIWDDYYRDQNLQSEDLRWQLTPGESLHDWSGEMAAGSVKRRAWMHDYLTSCLPFAQKGDAVQIPLVTQDDIPVNWNPDAVAGVGDFIKSPTTGLVDGSVASFTSSAGGSLQADGVPASIDNSERLSVDVQAGATTINTLRRAFKLQEFYELMARGGTRLTEWIRSTFNVVSSDARLQRPEHFGSVFQKMVISEVLQTAPETTSAVGQLAGHGISVGGNRPIRYRCEEHGIILGIINVQPVTAYMQGLHKMWSRQNYLDFAWPTFAQIGEQEVLNKEAQVFHASKNGVFGYIPRYAEYKFMNSRVAGEMRTTLNTWHLGRDLPTNVALNSEFISADPSTRIFAVTDEEEDHIVAHVINDVKVQRKLPRFGVPTI